MPRSDSITIASLVTTSAKGEFQNQSQKHLLIIDDDEAVLKILEHLLLRRNYRVSAFVDAANAIEAIREAPAAFDAVVTDYNMPEMAGLEVAKTIRDIRADLPVAMTSGFIEDDLQTRAEEAGVAGLISKPFTASKLYGVIEQLLGSRPSMLKSQDNS